MKKLLLAVILLGLTAPIASFADATNICQVIKVHPGWYKDAKAVQKKWGVPVSVQFAIIKQESDFDSNAKNHHSTAYGYAQAVNEIWSTYKSTTGQKEQTRTNFHDATNFIGWYAQRMHKQLDVAPDNAYDLYLSYHDGPGGYLKASHAKHAPSKRLAEHVEDVAEHYQTELLTC